MGFLNDSGVTTLWSRIKSYLTGSHVQTTAVTGSTNVDEALTDIDTRVGQQSQQIANLQAAAAYVEDGDNATVKTYSEGEFIVWKGSLYTVNSGGLPLGTAISGNVTAVTGGGFNALLGAIDDVENSLTNLIKTAVITGTTTSSGNITQNTIVDTRPVLCSYVRGKAYYVTPWTYSGGNWVFTIRQNTTNALITNEECTIVVWYI